MTTQAHDSAQDLVQMRLKDRINIRGDLKEFMARAVKELARKELRDALKDKGFEKISFDGTESLKIYVTVTAPTVKENLAPVERTFAISVKEVKSST